MPNVPKLLESLRQRIADRNEPGVSGADLQRLAVTQTDDQYNLDFFGDSFEESYFDLLETVSKPHIAAQIRSLILRCPDEGANGTHNWNIEPLVAANAPFPNLETFMIQLNHPADHNRSIVGRDYDEGGVLAKLLANSPNLCELTIPSAPDAAFFNVGERPIRFLSVDAGCDTQYFIRYLARSSSFPALCCLEWGEYNETYVDDYLAKCTPTDHYRELFQSNAFQGVGRFVWRNPICADQEIKDLKTLKPDVQLLVVRYSDHYV